MVWDAMMQSLLTRGSFVAADDVTGFKLPAFHPIHIVRPRHRPRLTLGALHVFSSFFPFDLH